VMELDLGRCMYLQVPVGQGNNRTRVAWFVFSFGSVSVIVVVIGSGLWPVVGWKGHEWEVGLC